MLIIIKRENFSFSTKEITKINRVNKQYYIIFLHFWAKFIIFLLHVFCINYIINFFLKILYSQRFILSASN